MSCYCHCVGSGRSIPCLSQRGSLQAECYHLHQLGRRKYVQLFLFCPFLNYYYTDTEVSGTMCRAQSLPAVLCVDYSWWCGMCLSPREHPKGAFLQFLLSCPLPSSNLLLFNVRYEGKSRSQNETAAVLSTAWAPQGTWHTWSSFSSSSAS